MPSAGVSGLQVGNTRVAGAVRLVGDGLHIRTWSNGGVPTLRMDAVGYAVFSPADCAGGGVPLRCIEVVNTPGSLLYGYADGSRVYITGCNMSVDDICPRADVPDEDGNLPAAPCSTKGAWDNGTGYLTGDVVSHDDTQWRAIRPSTGQEPGGVGYWDVYTPPAGFSDPADCDDATYTACADAGRIDIITAPSLAGGSPVSLRVEGSTIRIGLRSMAP
jgi:hypothetical protein